MRVLGGKYRGLIALALLIAVAGCARPGPPPGSAGALPADTRDRHHAPGDPLEGMNRGLFSVHQTLDRLLFRPLAIAYRTVIPKPIRTGIRHVLSNLTEPVVFVNDMLQLKPAKAVRTFARFTLNTTMGVGGVFDVAKAGEIPHRDNGFGNTLARYGVGPGPYLFVPLVGPTDLRDLVGGQADGAVLPLTVGNPFDRTKFFVTRALVGGLDQRAEADDQLKTLLGGAADPYATLRSVYQQSRAAEVAAVRGKEPDAGGLDDPLTDPDVPTDPAALPTESGSAPPLADAGAHPEPVEEPAK